VDDIDKVKESVTHESHETNRNCTHPRKGRENAGLRINAEKTKTMAFGIQDTNSQIIV